MLGEALVNHLRGGPTETGEVGIKYLNEQRVFTVNQRTKKFVVLHLRFDKVFSTSAY